MNPIEVFRTILEGQGDKLRMPPGSIPDEYKGWELSQSTRPLPDGTYELIVYATRPPLGSGQGSRRQWPRPPVHDKDEEDDSHSTPMQDQLRRRKMLNLNNAVTHAQESMTQLLEAIDGWPSRN